MDPCLTFVLDQNDKSITDHLETFARQGLRTLCIAYRDLSEEEYKKWKPIYDKAATALEDREEQLAEAYALLERQFDWLGVTAIEDKLQEGVPEAITKLREAGIRVWMLTGDKYTTAVQISTSCNLTSPGTNEIWLPLFSVERVELISYLLGRWSVNYDFRPNIT